MESVFVIMFDVVLCVGESSCSVFCFAGEEETFHFAVCLRSYGQCMNQKRPKHSIHPELKKTFPQKSDCAVMWYVNGSYVPDTVARVFRI